MSCYRLQHVDVAKSIVSLSVQGLPLGSTLSDGEHFASVPQPGAAIDITSWHHDQIEVSFPPSEPHPNSLQLLAIGRAARRNFSRIYRVSLLDVAAIDTPAPALVVLGLPNGAKLTDGENTLISEGEEHQYDILGWNLEALLLLPPTGDYRDLIVRLQPRHLSEDELDILGAVHVRLYSPNPYMNNTQVAQGTKTSAGIDLVVDHLHVETESQFTFTATAARVESIPTLTDDDLADLEALFRK